MSVQEKLTHTATKRLLALDGGGIRGLVSLQVLQRLETTLQTLLGRGDDFVLADFFDYVAGTSTGAIIATGLALGMKVERIRGLYHQAASHMFDKSRGWGRIHSRYRGVYITQLLQDEIGADTTLGSDRLRTLLMLVMRNATTDSPWPVSNNPKAIFNARTADGCNLDLPLWQLVRASIAAPSYFPPEEMTIGSRRFVFMDGGITVYNNPAFQLFLMATLQPYRLEWPASKDRLLLVSIGTGATGQTDAALRSDQVTLLYDVRTLPEALMYSAMQEQDFLCRIFGDCLVGDPIDSEVGDLHGVAAPGTPKLFTYLRYNPDLSAQGLARLGMTNLPPSVIQAMDRTDHILDLERIGNQVADRVDAAHFRQFV